MDPKQKQFLDAASKGKTRTIGVLLKSGVDVNIQDSRGLPTNRTALMHAAESGHLEVVELLIKAGARINAIDKGFPADCPGGNTALLLSIQKGHVQIANRLLDAGASPKTKGGGTSVINTAAYLGDEQLVKRLIALGANPDQRDSRGFTPIALAVQKGNMEIVEFLLGLGISPNSLNPVGAPILIDAVHGGQVELCKRLINRGANPNLGGADNFTPPMAACRCALEGIVKFLLSLKVQVNEQDSRGRTALDIVYWMQEPPNFAPDVLKRLVAMGHVKIHPPNYLGETVDLLRARGAKTGKELNETK
jgi:ankyrin repeat protein